MQTIGCACPCLDSSSTGPHRFQELPPALLASGGQKTLPTAGGDTPQFPCLAGWGGLLSGSQRLCPGGRGQKLPSPWLWSNSPACAQPSTPVSALLEGQSALPSYLSAAPPQAAQPAGAVTSTSDKMGQRTLSTAGGAVTPPLAWALGKPHSSRAGKPPHLRIQMRQICTPTSPLVTCAPDSVLQISKATGWDHCLGTADMSAVGRLLQAPPAFAVAVGVPAAWIHRFPTGGTRGRGETSLRMRRWPGGGAIRFLGGNFSYPLTQPVPASVVQGGFSLTPKFQDSLSGVSLLNSC